MEGRTAGWGSGLVGVIIFSGSLPATRVAVADFSPLFLTSARAAIAALLGAVFLSAFRQALPQRSDVLSLALVALGVVVGFPLLTALALQHITAAHSIVFIGLLPLATAIFGVARAGERPKPAFWLFSAAGAAAVAGFSLYGSEGGTLAGDLLMIAAILVCGLGYAEGARLSRRLGGWQVISWALLMSFPVMGAIALLTLPPGLSAAALPCDGIPVPGRRQAVEFLPETVRVRQVAFYRLMDIAPDRRRFRQHRAPGRRQPEQARAPVGRVGLRRDEAAPLQRLQVGGERRPVHRQKCRHAAEVRRPRPVERHQQGELPAGDAGRLQRDVEAAGQRPRRPLRMQAQAGVAHQKRGLERNVVGRSVHPRG